MAEVDPKPDQETMNKSREPRWIIDPREVQLKEDQRIRNWFASIMKKHESKLNNKWKNKEIVTSGTVEPEDIDIRVIYPHKDMQWIIYRDNTCWSIILMARRNGGDLLLAKSSFLKV